ncbi:MAG: ribosome biogenesis factor YjgA [Burkholderiales bacterium]
MNAHDDDPHPEGPSKSQRKRDSQALQDLGEALVALSPDRLARLELPDVLRSAVLEAQRIHKFGGLRRQKQYIGKLMRDLDAAPIQAQLDALEGHSRAQTAYLHRLERWRDRLLEDDQAMAELLSQHPEADAQHLRTLVRNAKREATESKPPRSFRELFRVLRQILPEPAATPPSADTDDNEQDSPA